MVGKENCGYLRDKDLTETFGLGEDTLNICLIHVTLFSWLSCLLLFQFECPIDKIKNIYQN